MTDISINRDLHNYFNSALSDGKLTIKERDNIEKLANNDGLNQNEQNLLDVVNNREKANLTSKYFFRSKKSEFDPNSLNYEVASYQDIKNGKYKVEIGDSGNTVNEINKKIKSLDYTFSNEGNKFSEKTKTFIIKVQSENGLEPNGIIDNKTLGALEEYPKKYPKSLEDLEKYSTAKISLGNKSQAVTDLNQIINKMDFNFYNPSDTFDEKTKEFITQFQTENNLTATGEVDGETLEKLKVGSEKVPSINNIKTKQSAELRLGHKGESVNKLHILLKKAIPDFNISSDSYGEETKTVISEFQKRNNLTVTGEVDKNTLIALEQSLKIPEDKLYDPNYVISDEISTDNINDYNKEKVKNLIEQQILDSGNDPDTAFEIGEELLVTAKKWDRKMGSDNKCYTAVKKSVEEGMGLPYRKYKHSSSRGLYGAWARTADKNYFKDYSENFIEITGLTRADTENLPEGAIIVYKPKNKSKAGHIGVQDGNGHDVSDKTRNQRNVHKTAELVVFFPVKSN